MFDEKKLSEEHENIVRSLKNWADDKEANKPTDVTKEQVETWIARKAEVEKELEEARTINSIKGMTFATNNASRSNPNIVRQGWTPKREMMAFKAWAGVGMGQHDIVRSEWKQAAYDLGRDLYSPSFIFRDAEVGMTNPGNTYVSSVYAGLEKQLKWQGGISSVCTVSPTTHGRTLVSGYIDDTANKADDRATGLTEVENTPAVFTSRSIDVHGVGSGIFYVDAWELENSEENLEAELVALLGERIARKVNYHTTIGSKTNDRGFMVDAGNSGVEIDFDDAEDIFDGIVDLYKSVDPAYRNLPDNYFYCTDTTHGILMKAKDPDTGERLWTPDAINGAGAGSLLGKPILICNEMANVSDGNGAKALAFGHAKAYVMRTVRQVEIKRFTEATVGEVNLALTNNIGFGAFYRFGGKLLNSTALKYAAATGVGS